MNDLKEIEIINHIRSRIREFSHKEYGWGPAGTELPLRADAHTFSDYVLFRPSRSDINLKGLGTPDVRLSTAGTIMIQFLGYGKDLILEIPCYGVVSYRKHFGIGGAIDGTCHMDQYEESEKLDVSMYDELNQCFDWLRTKGNPDEHKQGNMEAPGTRSRSDVRR